MRSALRGRAQIGRRRSITAYRTIYFGFLLSPMGISHFLDALLLPIDWPEPFGLVMIESMACGTPVIAYAGGSVAEVMDDGVTGFVVNDIEQAVEAVRRVRDLSRARCREVFEKRFTASRMANDY